MAAPGIGSRTGLPAPSTTGSRWIDLPTGVGTGTNFYYPTNGQGGASTTAGDSEVAGANKLLLVGLMVVTKPGIAAVLQVIRADDTATPAVIHTVGIQTNNTAPVWFPFGGDRMGIEVTELGGDGPAFTVRKNDDTLGAILYYLVVN